MASSKSDFISLGVLGTIFGVEGTVLETEFVIETGGGGGGGTGTPSGVAKGGGGGGGKLG